MGRLIVIEGLDGSGKATQSALLTEYLKKTQPVRKISFPDYSNKSSTLVQMYLKGEIGELSEVNVFAASSFYSLDRYISYTTLWSSDYKSGTTIVADRYTTSNLSHQMVKLPKEEWDAYIAWLEEYEYIRLGLPKPDLVVYLDMQPQISQELMKARYGGDEGQMDIHEKNLSYLLSCREAALYCAKKLGWHVIRCNDSDLSPLTVEAIAKMVEQVYNSHIGT